MEELEKRNYIVKVLDISIKQYKELKEDQKKANESIDKIVTWLIGFIFIFIGIFIGNHDKFNFINSKTLIVCLLIAIVCGVISRIFSYLFNLSYISNLSALELDKEFFDQDLNMNLLLEDEYIKAKWDLIKGRNKLLQLNSKVWVRKGLKIFKNIFVYTSILTVISFITSLFVLFNSFFC